MRHVRFRFLAISAVGVALVVLATSTLASSPQVGKVLKGTKVNGHIVQIKGKNQVIVRTVDNRDVILNINPQTKYILRNQAVIFTDVHEGVPVEVIYDATGDQFYAGSFTLTPAEFVEGEVVHIVEPDNQIVVKTTAGKEVIFVTEPTTSFTFENRHARLVDFRPGTTVRVHFDIRNQRHHAHSIWTMPRR